MNDCLAGITESIFRFKRNVSKSGQTGWGQKGRRAVSTQKQERLFLAVDVKQ